MKCLFSILFVSVVLSFTNTISNASQKIKILIDTDANNELDDQHALAYAFLNLDIFDVVGVTVNNTRNGDGIKGQYEEAKRIIKLFDLEDKVPLFIGAEKSYEQIYPLVEQVSFDGQPAVDFIIREAMKMEEEKLVLVPIGKLTNIALAILKEPKIVDKIRVIWLGGNYPDPGEYNLENDTSSVNPVIESGVEFEMVTVRYTETTGTAAVRVGLASIEDNMKGKGPVVRSSITGRHGGSFTCFGDYSVNLFRNAKMYGNPPARSLFDMAVLAILKNENWGERVEIPAPKLVGNTWIEQANNNNKISYWENFNRDAIVNDLFGLMHKATPTK